MRANVGCSWLGLIVIGGHFVLEIIEAELFCPMNDRQTTYVLSKKASDKMSTCQ